MGTTKAGECRFMAGLTCLVLAISAATASADAAGNHVSVSIGSVKQLFLDHRFIAASEGIALVVNPPVKRPEAVIVSDKPWDAFRIIWLTVAEDNGEVKMVYQAFDNDQWGCGRSRLGYAVSKDGLT